MTRIASSWTPAADVVPRGTFVAAPLPIPAFARVHVAAPRHPAAVGRVVYVESYLAASGLHLLPSTTEAQLIISADGWPRDPGALISRGLPVLYFEPGDGPATRHPGRCAWAWADDGAIAETEDHEGGDSVTPAALRAFARLLAQWRLGYVRRVPRSPAGTHQTTQAGRSGVRAAPETS